MSHNIKGTDSASLLYTQKIPVLPHEKAVRLDSALKTSKHFDSLIIDTTKPSDPLHSVIDTKNRSPQAPRKGVSYSPWK